MSVSKLSARVGYLCVGMLLLLQAAAYAAPITFLFTFQQPRGPARATGFITFEQTLLPNPASCTMNDELSTAGPVVLNLRVTVSGATSGNGTFTKSNFANVAWCTNGGMLDFSSELVGQPTANDPWGTPSDGDGGDFNLFANASGAPDGEFFFTLCANHGNANCMQLTSMIAGTLRGSSVPALTPRGLIGLAVLLLGIGLGTIARIARRPADIYASRLR